MPQVWVVAATTRPLPGIFFLWLVGFCQIGPTHTPQWGPRPSHCRDPSGPLECSTTICPRPRAHQDGTAMCHVLRSHTWQQTHLPFLPAGHGQLHAYAARTMANFQLSRSCLGCVRTSQESDRLAHYHGASSGCNNARHGSKSARASDAISVPCANQNREAQAGETHLGVAQLEESLSATAREIQSRRVASRRVRRWIRLWRGTKQLSKPRRLQRNTYRGQRRPSWEQDRPSNR